ncbi:MAG TPA: DUF4262 domain-containing protein [Acidimicrobiales bacterium]|nr:DUF4262 domain-containing protein [Acidimicrobiales bacterium]
MPADQPARSDPCHCVIHEPPDDRDGWSDDDRTLVADVGRHGWALVGVDAGPAAPGWAFTVGLWHSFGHPELAAFGLGPDELRQGLDALAEQVRAGRRLTEGTRADLAVAGVPGAVTFRRALGVWYPHLFDDALWFARRPPLPVLQVVWPDDGTGRGPDQPRLWLTPQEHPRGWWTELTEPEPWPFPVEAGTAVFTTRRIATEGRPVVHVVHDEEGDWQLLDGEVVTADDAVLARLDDLVAAHPRVAEVADLPRGWEAWQDPPGSPWARQPVSPDEA